jgi:uncharacterized protein
MRNSGTQLLFSASDISNHLPCRYATFLDLQVATGQMAEPVYRDPALAILQERGLEFELAYLAHLRAQGLRISEPGGGDAGLARTVNAMQAGYDVIYQADLAAGVWQGRADFLMRVERESKLGPWSYEVVDTKLAKETKGNRTPALPFKIQNSNNAFGSISSALAIFSNVDNRRSTLPFSILISW